MRCGYCLEKIDPDEHGDVRGVPACFSCAEADEARLACTSQMHGASWDDARPDSAMGPESWRAPAPSQTT
jgi:hypothetical protein